MNAFRLYGVMSDDPEIGVMYEANRGISGLSSFAELFFDAARDIPRVGG